MWQFAEACRGLADGCRELGIPVTGGNVSLYNQTGETAILPTPVVAVLGVIDDVTRRTPSAFVAAGERVLLLGETREELSGSEWAHVVHGHLGGLPPAVDLAAEKALAELLREARRAGDQRARPLRGRARPGAGRGGPRQRRRRAGRARRGRPVRRAVLRVGRPGAGHGPAGDEERLRRPGRRATACPSPRWARPAATRSTSPASSTLTSPTLRDGLERRRCPPSSADPAQMRRRPGGDPVVDGPGGRAVRALLPVVRARAARA